MKAGDLVEIAIWLSGTETPDMIRAFKDRAQVNTTEAAKKLGLIVAPFSWETKKPGEDRVPPVPKEISGINVELLVGEALLILDRPVIMKQSGFVYDLEMEDLARLRKITRRAHAKVQPGSKLNNQQCDAIIEQLGPASALRTLRGHLDA